MAEPEKNFLQQLIEPFSSWKASFEELRQRIGWLGAVVVLLIAAVIAASFYIWSNWKDIKERPGIEGVIKRFKRRAMRHACGRLKLRPGISHDRRPIGTPAQARSDRVPSPRVIVINSGPGGKEGAEREIAALEAAGCRDRIIRVCTGVRG